VGWAGNGRTVSKASTALGSCRLYSSDKAMFVAHPMLVGSSLSASRNSSAAFDDCPDASAKNALCWSPHAPAAGPQSSDTPLSLEPFLSPQSRDTPLPPARSESGHRKGSSVVYLETVLVLAVLVLPERSESGDSP
jgi:hypothetical protein